MNPGREPASRVGSRVLLNTGHGKGKSSAAFGVAPELTEIADTVTEMRKIKHAYDQGIRGRRGIEY